jgi:hypothetical protein
MALIHKLWVEKKATHRIVVFQSRKEELLKTPIFCCYRTFGDAAPEPWVDG